MYPATSIANERSLKILLSITTRSSIMSSFPVLFPFPLPNPHPLINILPPTHPRPNSLNQGLTTPILQLQLQLQHPPATGLLFAPAPPEVFSAPSVDPRFQAIYCTAKAFAFDGRLVDIGVSVRYALGMVVRVVIIMVMVNNMVVGDLQLPNLLL